jgi:acyl carrier protein
MTIKDPITLVATALSCDPATLVLDSGLNRHPAWDSLGHLSVMIALQREYGIEITDENIRRFELLAAILEDFASSNGEGEAINRGSTSAISKGI